MAIHCAYGFNRTGFALCAFLVEQCGLSADAALASFATARSPGVGRNRYLLATSIGTHFECLVLNVELRGIL